MTIKEGNLKPLTLVDDDEFSHVIFKALVKAHYASIPVATYLKPLEVIHKIASNSFTASAIVLDINMPVMNGWAFLSQLEGLSVDIPVYMLSSSDDPRDIAHASKFRNVSGYFVKPMRIPDLDLIVEAITGQRKPFH